MFKETTKTQRTIMFVVAILGGIFFFLHWAGICLGDGSLLVLRIG